jgi:hypothetical protein
MSKKEIKHEDVNDRVNVILSNIEKGDYTIYFYATDTKGYSVGSVSQTYKHAKILNENGFKVAILYDNDKYVSVDKWLGEEYSKLPHISLSADGKPNDIKIKPEDYLIVPEVYANIMQQTSILPCKKIVMCQNYSYITEVLPIDKNWGSYGFNDVITTSSEMESLVNSLFPTINTHVVDLVFNDEFLTKPIETKKPIISFVTKEQSDFRIILNMFFRKYPLFRWFTPRELRGLSEREYADALKESSVVVWVDKRSSFGAVPIESMKCGTPVIGLLPYLMQEWMGEKDDNDGVILKNNVIWVGSILDIPEILHNFCQSYVTDSLPSDLYLEMDNTIERYKKEDSINKIVDVYKNIVNQRVAEFKTLIVEK